MKPENHLQCTLLKALEKVFLFYFSLFCPNGITTSEWQKMHVYTVCMYIKYNLLHIYFFIFLLRLYSTSAEGL